MGKIISRGALLIAVFCLMGGLVACEKPGPAEKTGQKIDKAVDTVKEKAQEVTE